MSTATMMPLEEITLDDLHAMQPEARDALPFGVVGLDRDNLVQIYSNTESRLAGLPPETVLGLHYFDAVAQCMNNYLVAQRFEDEPELDDVLPYVLTLRMRPTRVRLRLLASSRVPLRYILIQR